VELNPELPLLPHAAVAKPVSKERPPRLGKLLSRSSPLRWGVDRWLAITGVVGCSILLIAVAICLVSLSVPPPIIALLGIAICFFAGFLVSFAMVAIGWITAGLNEWSARWLRWTAR
jgi:hypothetical protein